MKITKKALLTALDKTASLATRRTTLPILQHLLISASGGKLSVTGTDLNCHARALCDCDGDLDAVCVPAQAFTGLAKVARDDIELTLVNQRLAFKSNGTANLATLPGIEYPIWPSNKFTAIGLPCGDLAEGIESVSWSADNNPTDTSRPLVTVVWVRTEAKRMRVGATTGQTLAHMDRGLICAETEFMVPCAYADKLTDVLKRDEATLSVCDNWVAVSSPMLNVAVKRHEGGYFNLDVYLNQEQVIGGMLPVKEILDAIDNALVLTGIDKFCSAMLVPDEGGATFTYESEVNCYKTHIDGITIPRPIRFGMALMKDALSRVVSDTPRVNLGVQGLLVKDGDVTIGVALMCISKPEAPVPA